jgi:hypothetical protein
MIGHTLAETQAELLSFHRSIVDLLELMVSVSHKLSAYLDAIWGSETGRNYSTTSVNFRSISSAAGNGRFSCGAE